MKNNRWLVFLIISGPLLLLILFGLERVFTHFPLYDDAYNATVAKNLAHGYGYSTSYDTIIPFNPEVTTGPSVLLPTAVLIKLIGVKYWVPGFSVFLISVILVSIIFVLVYKYYDDNLKKISKPKRWILLLLVMLYISLFWISDFREIEFLGEFPSGLFVCAGILAIFNSYNKSSALIGGMILGFAIMSKLSSLIMVITVCIAWGIFFIIDRKSSEFTGSKLVPLFLFIGVILPVFLFESWKFITLGIHGFVVNANWSIDFFLSHGSGINETLSIDDGLVNYAVANLIKNFKVLQDSPSGIFRFYVFIAILIGMVGLIFNKFRAKTIFTTIERVSLTSLLATFFYVSWWLLLSSLGWYRHLQPGIVVMSFAIVISFLALFLRKAFVPLTFILIIWVILYPGYWTALLVRPKIPSELINASSKTIDFLILEKLNGRSLLGCGWWANRRLEYLLPDSLNFQDCYSSDLKNSDLVVDGNYWNWEKNPSMGEIDRRCSELVFDVYPYSVYRCD